MESYFDDIFNLGRRHTSLDENIDEWMRRGQCDDRRSIRKMDAISEGKLETSVRAQRGHG